MKVIRSNSKTQYNFCGTNKLSFKERVIAGNSYIPTKQDMSVDALREPGNSYVDEKVNMTKQEQSKSSQNTSQQSKQTSNNSTNKSGFVRVNKPVTFGSLVKSLSNLGKSDFSKSNYERCIDGYVQEGLTRDEAKFGCRGESKQVNSAAKPWDDAYDELDKETSKIDRSKKSSSSEGVTELDGRKLRNERHVVRHSPTDPQFNAKSTLANSNKKTGTYNGQEFDTKCRDNYMKMGIDRFTAAQACIGKQG